MQRSIAAMPSAWLRKNVRQLCDGGPRASDHVLGNGALQTAVRPIAVVQKLISSSAVASEKLDPFEL
jgi:hypothetical protein